MNTTRQSALLTEFYDTYSQPLYGYLCRLVRDRACAEELLQDVYTRAYRALPRLGEGANYRAWLYRIATNAARDWHRRQSIRPWQSWRATSDETRDGDETEPDPAPALPVEERLAIEEALQALAPMYRVPLVLYAIEGLTTEEIAKVLGIGRSAVKMRLARARSQFQASYGADRHV
ncbi:MAG: RNA polymerase sigma factor [Chloroflexi bacterium]|nr:RNA polymerase sigma factor [Chloroflexota bacterium]